MTRPLPALLAGAWLAACSGGFGGVTRIDGAPSPMLLGDTKAPLLYVDDDAYSNTYVFDYRSGTLAGRLTGFDYPEGMCVDKEGDVYIANFDSGEVIEYAHGGTSPINTYTESGAFLTGCAVDADGALAVTASESSSGHGSVCVWKRGKGSPTCYTGGSACYYLSTFVYDSKGDLVGFGGGQAKDMTSQSGATVCELPAGKSAMRTLTLKGFSLDSPGGMSWDGKYLVVSGETSSSGFQTGLQAARISGATLVAVGSPIALSDNCYSDYTRVLNPFFFGKENVTAASNKRATGVAGANLWCYDAGKPAVDAWKYPAGGSPARRFTSGLIEPYGAAISIAD